MSRIFYTARRNSQKFVDSPICFGYPEIRHYWGGYPLATVDILLGVFGGLGLFIYGMSLMSKGMQKAAGDKLRKMIEMLTYNRYIAVLTGVIVTALVQSSSTTSVMVVGFVNAGLMTLNQAMGTILGARIGTTITAQIIAFNIASAALPIIGLGVILFLFVKRRTYRNIGQALLGFGILFLGLSIMGGNLNQLGDNPAFVNMLAAFGHNRLLGVLTGALFTAIIQSSSATVGVIIVLAGEGILDLDAALALTLGACAGTSVTALLASIGTNLAARRAAMAHVLFSILGSLMLIGFLDYVAVFARLLSTELPRQIALGQTLMAVVTTLSFLPLISFFARLVKIIIPGEDISSIRMGSQYLDRRLLPTPSIALGAAKKEIQRMAGLAVEMVDNALDMLFADKLNMLAIVEGKEEVMDELESDITVYLAELSHQSISAAQGRDLASLFHAINDLERIGDHALNIAQLCDQRAERRLVFSDQAMEDIRRMYAEVKDIMTKAVTAFAGGDRQLARQVMAADRKIDQMEKQLRESHICRINEGKCFPPSGVVFLDIIANLERIGDHSTNIAQAVLGEL